MIEIIKANEEHIPGIFKIGKELISPAWTQEMLLDELRKGESVFFVARDINISGFAVFRKVGDDGEILQIAVDKSMHRKGIGDMLIGAVIDFAQLLELNSIFLEVRKSNTPAVRLYIKNGFKEVRVRKDYYFDPVEDALVMVRRKK